MVRILVEALLGGFAQFIAGAGAWATPWDGAPLSVPPKPLLPIFRRCWHAA